MDSLKLVFVTHPPGKTALELAKKLVELKFAACVNVIPKVISVYSWKGKLNSDGESLLIIKTTSSRVDELEGYLIKNHPYDTPEFVVCDPTAVTKKYLAWVLGIAPPRSHNKTPEREPARKRTRER